MNFSIVNIGRRGFFKLGMVLVGNHILFGNKKLFSFPGNSHPALDCVVRPEQTEGPYFRDQMLNHSDIRIDPTDNSISPGIPLHLTLRVSQTNGTDCIPLPNAIVDLWQCDAIGLYSDVKDINGFFDTRGKKFLRGYQVTNSEGIANFTTIYPGWYRGRAVHIHFKIRTNPNSNEGQEFTSQLYFDDTFSEEVAKSEPYSTNANNRVKNHNDGLFQSGGDQLLVPLTKNGDEYSGIFDIALQTDFQTGIKDKNYPDGYTLGQNYPNPFNSSTVIKYSLPASSYVTLKIYDAFGVETQTLVNDINQAGTHEVKFTPGKLSSGVYYYRLKANKYTETKKLVLLK